MKISERELVRRRGEEAVVEPEVPDVVHERREQRGELLRAVEVLREHAPAGAAVQEVEHPLRDVRGVERVVVRVVRVALLDDAQERRELRAVEVERVGEPALPEHHVADHDERVAARVRVRGDRAVQGPQVELVPIAQVLDEGLRLRLRELRLGLREERRARARASRLARPPLRARANPPSIPDLCEPGVVGRGGEVPSLRLPPRTHPHTPRAPRRACGSAPCAGATTRPPTRRA